MDAPFREISPFMANKNSTANSCRSECFLLKFWYFLCKFTSVGSKVSSTHWGWSASEFNYGRRFNTSSCFTILPCFRLLYHQDTTGLFAWKLQAPIGTTWCLLLKEYPLSVSAFFFCSGLATDGSIFCVLFFLGYLLLQIDFLWVKWAHFTNPLIGQWLGISLSL